METNRDKESILHIFHGLKKDEFGIFEPQASVKKSYFFSMGGIKFENLSLDSFS